MSTLGSDYKIGINLWKGNIFLEVDDWGGLHSDLLPNLCEWTRIEISHEGEDGKYFITFSVGGKEVLRTEVDESDFGNLEDVKIHIGGFFSEWGQPGFVRGLSVLEKQ